MNKICLIALACLLALPLRGVAQQNDSGNIAGVYSLQQSSDPHGFLNLILSPDGVFVIAAFGTLEYGTWDVYKNYLIFQPAKILEDHFYISAKYDPEREDIYVQFDGFIDVYGLYSFDNEDFSQDMHPVFNPYPNCITYPYYIVFEKGDHTSLQLLQKSYWNDEAETTAEAYNFILPERYNEFTVLAINDQSGLTHPALLVIDGPELRVEGEVLDKRSDYGQIREEEKQAVADISEMLRDPDIRTLLSMRYDDDVFGEILRYQSKELRTVSFDQDNLFEANCNDYYDGTLLDYEYDYDEEE